MFGFGTGARASNRARACGDAPPAGRSNRTNPMALGLLDATEVSTSRGIRHRLLSILLLCIIVSGLSAVALINLLTTRPPRGVGGARGAAIEQVERRAKAPAGVAPDDRAVSSIVGLRAGIWDGT